jgi:nucleoside phosphorylase
LTTARAVLDKVHNEVVICEDDNNPYLLGNIGHCNIVIACLPINQYGTNDAAALLANMMRTFPSIEFGLVVGVGGGAPSAKTDIRLGDIVVGTEVIQYDLGKCVSPGDFECTAIPKRLSKSLRKIVPYLTAKHEPLPKRISLTLRERFQNYPKYCRPKCPDRLFQATYNHPSSNLDCDRCDQTRLI